MKTIKNIIKPEEAVSEVIGMVLVLSITMLVIGSIMLVGMPMIDAGKKKAQMDITANSFLSLQNDIDEVIRGPIWIVNPYNRSVERLGPSRETEFELTEGSLSVLPGDGLYCRPVFNCSNTSVNDFTVIMPQGNITYSSDSEKIVYENGAVIRKYESGTPLMISDPLINIYDIDQNNITVAIHSVNLTGTLSSVGGEGKAWAEIRPLNYTEVVPANSSPNLNQLNITIYSRYSEAWRNYFDNKLNGILNASARGNITGYNISGTDPLFVEIYGNSNNRSVPDIFLTVYDSKVDIKVR